MDQKASRGTNIIGVRAYNDRLILTLIRKNGMLPRIEISRKTGLSPTAVSAIVKKLEKNHLVKPGKVERGKIGQPSMPFSINSSGAYSLGLKIGRRSAELVLINFLGEVVDLAVFEYDFPKKSAILEFATTSSLQLRSALSKRDQDRIVGLGVATPNEIWKWEQLFKTPRESLRQWSDDAHFNELEKALGLPVYHMNDTTAACGAELTINDHLDSNSFIYFFIGWFIGGGIVIDHKLHMGQSRNAGAIGSMLVNDTNGRQKQLIYTSSISALEEKLSNHGVSSNFKWGEQRWKEESAIIEEWIHESAYGIAQACAAAHATVDFEHVIIDGDIPARIRNRLFAKTKELYDTLDTTGMAEMKFLEGKVGPQARSIGAACLPLISGFGLDFDVLFKGTTEIGARL